MNNSFSHHIRDILTPGLIIFASMALFLLFSCSPDTTDVPQVTSPPIEEEETVAEEEIPVDNGNNFENMKIIINHTNFDWYNNQSQEVIDSVASLKIFFSHASVGSNIISGFADLNSADSSKYPLKHRTIDASPPAQTKNGIIYEHRRGNPGWSAKISNFETCIKNGWHYPKVDISMQKFCWIDHEADLTAYLDSMTALEASYPDTKFVYFTMPLSTEKNSNAVRRAQFNAGLRDWIDTQDNKFLFDLADIESYSPDGVPQTFMYQDREYENLYPEYTFDEGHLNEAGRQRMATGLYSLFGQMISTPANSH